MGFRLLGSRQLCNLYFSPYICLKHSITIAMTSILLVFMSKSLSKVIPTINEQIRSYSFTSARKDINIVQSYSLNSEVFKIQKLCRSKTSTKTVSRPILIFNASLPLLKTFVILLYTLQLLQFPSPSASNENQMEKKAT